MAASDKSLGALHQKVAEALTEQVEGYDEPVFDQEGEEKGTKRVRPSPALLGAAIAFLKNNNITADATENEALKDLSTKLAARRKGKIPQAALDEAADAFASAHGGGMMQ